jgi:ribosome-binding protein aMBF1 (putative translation factor)
MEYKINNLKIIMRMNDLSIRDLAKKTNIKKSTLYSRINKKTVFKLPEAKKIANFFNVDLVHLFYDKEKVFLDHYVQKNGTKINTEEKNSNFSEAAGE